MTDTVDENVAPIDLEDMLLVSLMPLRPKNRYPAGGLLFHYTDPGAFLSITEKAEFWASDFRFMNDNSEFQYGINVFRDSISERVKTEKIHYVKECLDFLLSHFTIDMVNEKSSMFVVSFCEAGNDLSQWRAYGKGGAAFSIGLNFSDVRAQNVLVERDAVIFQVEYHRDRQIAIADNYVKYFCSAVKEQMGHYDVAETATEASRIFTYNAIEHVVRFKNPCFETEKEWRLISSKEPKTTSADFRSSVFGLTPYYKLQLGLAEKDGLKKLPLTTIYVGPSAYADLSVTATKSYLTKIGYPDVEVLPSNLPLRF